MNNKGVTLIESIITIALLALVLVPLSNLFVAAIKNNSYSEASIEMKELAQGYMEQIRATPFTSLDTVLVDNNGFLTTDDTVYTNVAEGATITLTPDPNKKFITPMKITVDLTNTNLTDYSTISLKTELNNEVITISSIGNNIISTGGEFKSIIQIPNYDGADLELTLICNGKHITIEVENNISDKKLKLYLEDVNQIANSVRPTININGATNIDVIDHHTDANLDISDVLVAGNILLKATTDIGGATVTFDAGGRTTTSPANDPLRLNILCGNIAGIIINVKNETGKQLELYLKNADPTGPAIPPTIKGAARYTNYIGTLDNQSTPTGGSLVYRVNILIQNDFGSFEIESVKTK